MKNKGQNWRHIKITRFTKGSILNQKQAHDLVEYNLCTYVFQQFMTKIQAEEKSL